MEQIQAKTSGRNSMKVQTKLKMQMYSEQFEGSKEDGRKDYQIHENDKDGSWEKKQL